MQAPSVEIVMLLLVILLFGTLQHSRPQVYYRLWFVGWILILLSYAVWEMPLPGRVLAHVQDAVRYDFMIAGTLFFLLSFAPTRQRLWAVVSKGLWIGVPAVLAIDGLQFFPVPKAVLIVAVVAWESYGLRAAAVLLPKEWRATRAAIYTICVVFGVGLVSYLLLSPGRDLIDWTLAEIVLSTAVLYLQISDKRSLADWVGTVGFAMWGVFYLAVYMKGWPATVTLVHQFWSLPKYFVGFSMILKTSEDATNEQLRLAEEFRVLYEDSLTLFEGHPHAMWIYAAEDGGFLSANGAAVKNYGYSREEFLGMQVADLTAMNEADAKLLDALYPGSGAAGATLTRHSYKDGRKVWVDVADSAIQFQGKAARFLRAQNVTDRMDAAAKLIHQVNHDVLTGLPNRTLLEDRLEQRLANCSREHRKGALMTIDVDHFKWVNDTHGHQVGDECLRAVAGRLKGQIRQVDTIARTGGEEFTAIIGGLHHEEDARKIAGILLRVFDTPLRLGDLNVPVTVSIGVAMFPDDGTDAKTLTLRSDEALYAAKRAGRNCAVFAAKLAWQGDTVAEEIGVN